MKTAFTYVSILSWAVCWVFSLLVYAITLGLLLGKLRMQAVSSDYSQGLVHTYIGVFLVSACLRYLATVVPDDGNTREGLMEYHAVLSTVSLIFAIPATVLLLLAFSNADFLRQGLTVWLGITLLVALIELLVPLYTRDRKPKYDPILVSGSSGDSVDDIVRYSREYSIERNKNVRAPEQLNNGPNMENWR